jgi:hypothetical protein
MTFQQERHEEIIGNQKYKNSLLLNTTDKGRERALSQDHSPQTLHQEKSMQKSSVTKGANTVSHLDSRYKPYPERTY